MRIYGDLGSGNCQKVKMVADYLRLPYEWVAIDIMKGESRTRSFLERNPFGQIPVAEFADGRHLAQSNAILRYLARGSTLIPADPFDGAKADELMFWEQYSHEPYVAVARFQMLYLGKGAAEREARVVERGEKALDTMERLLAGRRYLVADRLSVADIALLPYTRLAHEGGFDLSSRPAVRAWIAVCERDLNLTKAPAAPSQSRH